MDKWDFIKLKIFCTTKEMVSVRSMWMKRPNWSQIDKTSRLY
jgi:hypothetical protein